MAKALNKVGWQLFGFTLLLVWIYEVFNIQSADKRVLGQQWQWLGHWQFLLFATLLFTAFLAAFIRGRRQILFGSAVFIFLFMEHLLARKMGAGLGATEFMPPAVLLGYVFFYTAHYSMHKYFGHPLSSAMAQRIAIDAACGVNGASYVLAAIAKLRVSGLSWIDGRNLALLIMERSYGAQPMLGLIRRRIAYHPHFCIFLAFIALVVELSGFLFIIRKFRFRYALAAVALHTGIGLLMGYFVPPWPMTCLSLAMASS